MLVKIDIVIPVLNELKLGETLGKLYEQDGMEPYITTIWIVEYDPDRKETGKRIVEKFNEVNKTKVQYMTVNRPGIAFARHTGIMAGNSPLIVNFDGDARFEHRDGLIRMVEPIVNDNKVLTCCRNSWNETEIPQTKQGEMKWMKMVMEHLSNSQNNPFWAFLEPGSAMLREAYQFVGGYDDVDRWELWELSGRMMYNYPSMKKYVSDVNVIVSPRRVLGWTEKTLSILNYSNYNPRIVSNQHNPSGVS